jgi:hypothetical protein
MKIEFDMNTIDSAYEKTNFSRDGIYIDHVDTSREQENLFAYIYKRVIRYRIINKVKEKLKAKIWLSNNQQIMSFVKDLYSDYDIYNNYLTFLIKVSPVPCSKQGLMSIIMS